ncbi:thioredoxin family protein [Pueribacillus sp. YX66]|uniref:thioredoxin family protein n=1 Tax=Pueribacillus sp. YX66 TaxID=3229242 RepID=UPI00358D77D6
MKNIEKLNEIKEIIAKHKITLLFISQPNCSVCHALLPQVELLLKKFPNIQSLHIDSEKTPEIIGEYLIFSAPVVIVLVDGKEMIRKARFVPIKELEDDITKLINAI